jgi:hypothetical protein
MLVNSTYGVSVRARLHPLSRAASQILEIRFSRRGVLDPPATDYGPAATAAAGNQEAGLPKKESVLVRKRLFGHRFRAAAEVTPSESKRSKTGFPLEEAACRRATIFPVCHEETRESFSPVESKTAG